MLFQVFVSYPISYFRCLKGVLLVLSTCLHLHQLVDMALHQEIFSLVVSLLVRNASIINMYLYLHIDIHVAELPKNAADIEESITDVALTDRGTCVWLCRLSPAYYINCTTMLTFLQLIVPWLCLCGDRSLITPLSSMVNQNRLKKPSWLSLISIVGITLRCQL